MHRIVVTGLGLVSPLGTGVDLVWRRLCASKSGVVRLPDDLVSGIACKVGARVPSISDDPEGGFDPDKILDGKEQRRNDLFIHFALGAAEEAITSSGFKVGVDVPAERVATVFASGVGGFPGVADAVRQVENQGARRLSPFTIPSFLVNLAAGQITIRYGFKGPIGAPVTACAASVQAIGDAVRMIRAGEADAALAGGTEACIDKVSLGGFAAARAMSTGFADDPAQSSRPFDAARDGFVMGEGAGALMLERMDIAIARGAPILGEILGYGTTSDAYHITSGPEDGSGAARAMKIALAQSGIAPAEIGYLNAHATSTPVGDKGELAAIRSVFGNGAGPAISSTKSATGHLLGAAGAAEAIFTILALRDSILPPTLNLSDPDPAAEGLDLIGPSARSAPISYAMSNGFGFGGVNASVLIGGASTIS